MGNLVEICNRTKINMFKILLPILILTLNLSLLSAEQDEGSNRKQIMVSRQKFTNYIQARAFCNSMASDLYQVPVDDHVSYLNGLADYLGKEKFSANAVIDNRIIKSDYYKKKREKYDRKNIQICLVVRKTKWWHKVFGNFDSVVIDIEDCSEVNAHAVCETERQIPENAGRSSGAQWTSVNEKKVKEARKKNDGAAVVIGFIFNCLWMSGCCLCCCCCGQAPWLKDEWWEDKPAEPAATTVTTVTQNPLGMGIAAPAMVAAPVMAAPVMAAPVMQPMMQPMMNPMMQPAMQPQQPQGPINITIVNDNDNDNK